MEEDYEYANEFGKESWMNLRKTPNGIILLKK